ncbi:MAG: MBL fold metallo-hydrolase [Campylobacteraceae bacterium]|jgi:phosphoribosyl 1,2-cyclic phosphate phosphodiesterase|nr:MBL fold metallo-hydrolase [Campylobacteraceae bacterium]
MHEVKLKFIGTSDTAGTPVYGCNCTACSMYRESGRVNGPSCAYIDFGESVIFIDSGSDLLLKIREGKKFIAQFLTHFHADHAYGLLRLRHMAASVPCYHPKDERGFADVLQRPHGFRFIENRPFESIIIQNIEFIPVPLVHTRPTHGYIIKTPNKSIAYLTDCSDIEKQSLEFLKEQRLDCVFIDASYDIVYDEGKHLNFDKANKMINKIGAKEGFLIHQSHYSLSYILKHKIKLKYPYIFEGFEYKLSQ